jgi:hypothetical protein
MIFAALGRRCHEDPFEQVKAEQDMGLDSLLFIPTSSRAQGVEHPDLRGLPIRFHSAVETSEWREDVSDDYPILHKKYTTPAGGF